MALANCLKVKFQCLQSPIGTQLSSFLYILSVCFHGTAARPNGHYRDHMAQKAWNIYYLVLHRKKKKNVPTPGLEDGGKLYDPPVF